MRLGPIIASGTRSTVHRCGDDHVAKVPLPSTPDRWIRDEAAYTRAVRAAGAPAPRLIDVVEHDDRPVGIYERIDGPSLWELIHREPARAAAYGEMLAEVHLRVFAIGAPITLPRQRDRLSGKVHRAAHLTGLDVVAALELIPRGGPANGLCHGDLHPANVLMSERGPVLVDWFDACRGAPLGDVARTSLLIGAPEVTDVAHLPGADPDTLVTLHDSYLARIAADAPFDAEEFRRWRRVEAAARLAEGVEPAGLLRVWRDEDAALV